MNNLYVTVIDSLYALRALTLYRSMEPYLEGNCFSIYCTDSLASKILKSFNLRNCQIFSPEDFVTNELKEIQLTRSESEFCWTCKPVAMEHGINDNNAISWVIYLDADIMVFANPDKILPQQNEKCMVLTPHGASCKYFVDLIPTVGKFNAGYVAFRNNDNGKNALSWWRRKCEELCPATPTNGVYADQKYLEFLPGLFQGTFESSHKGLNAGPWNILGEKVYLDRGKILIDGDELILYHMQGFKVLGEKIFDAYRSKIKIDKNLMRLIYKPYSDRLKSSMEELNLSNSDYKFKSELNLLSFEEIFFQIKRIVLGKSNLMFGFFWLFSYLSSVAI